MPAQRTCRSVASSHVHLHVSGVISSPASPADADSTRISRANTTRSDQGVIRRPRSRTPKEFYEQQPIRPLPRPGHLSTGGRRPRSSVSVSIIQTPSVRTPRAPIASTSSQGPQHYPGIPPHDWAPLPTNELRGTYVETPTGSHYIYPLAVSIISTQRVEGTLRQVRLFLTPRYR